MNRWLLICILQTLSNILPCNIKLSGLHIILNCHGYLVFVEYKLSEYRISYSKLMTSKHHTKYFLVFFHFWKNTYLKTRCANISRTNHRIKTPMLAFQKNKRDTTVGKNQNLLYIFGFNYFHRLIFILSITWAMLYSLW